MFRFHGLLPAFIASAAVLLWSTSAVAQHHTPLTLAEAEDLALDNEPGMAALNARAEALEERSIAAGQLPEPTLRVGINNFPIGAGGFSTEGMTHAAVGLRQAFPRGESRHLSGLRHTSQADEMTAAEAARGREVLSAARQAWLDAYYWQQAHALVLESQPFFEDLARISRSLYAVGRRDQQDLLRAELELSRLNDRLIETARQQREARAALSQWIGDDARRPIAPKLPAWDDLPEFAALQKTLREHPVLRAAEAQVRATDASVDLANEQTKPGWALDLGYSYREGSLASGEPRSDFISLNVTVDLPFLGRKNRQDRELAAALSERRAAGNEKARLERELESRMQAEYARWQEIDRRLALFESRILPQTQDQAEAALTAYQSDAGDFADVMRGYIDNLNAQLDLSRLQVERAKSYAVLANLGGITP
jgi:outer membrane protein TolC